MKTSSRAYWLVLLSTLLALAPAAHSQVTNVIFQDDFESGQILFPAGAWTTTAANPLDISTPTNAAPAGGTMSAFMNVSTDRMHRSLGGELNGHILFTSFIFDDGTTTATSGSTRVFNELRGYSGGTGLPNGGTTASGTLALLLAVGKTQSGTFAPGEVLNTNKYQGRVAFGSPNGWLNLDGPGSPNRSPGWHRFDVEVLPPGSTIRFYVDGILCRTFSGATVGTYDTVILGPGLGTQSGGAWIDGIRVAQIVDPSVGIMCPPNLTVVGTSGTGGTVNYLVSASGGCSTPSISCIPPSGASFPIGLTTVNCSANDICASSATCSFTVNVLHPGAPEVFNLTNNLPPAAGEYVSPDQWHVLFANGIIISNASHDRFVNPGPSNVLYGPPAAGGSNAHPFNSTATFEVSLDSGATFQTVSAQASVNVGVGHVGSLGGKDHFATEMQSFDIQGGSLPAGMMIRESPSLPSRGHTTVRQVPGGYMIGSFFDIWTEISVDSGMTWSPANGPIRVKLKNKNTAPPVDEPTDLLPPPNDHYVSPQDWHAAYAAGIVIKDVSHSSFLQSHPPVPGATNTHNFGSTIDLKISVDGGATFTAARVSAPVTVTVADAGSGNYDTEMTALSLSGGDLPSSVMLRESPTEPSLGRTRVAPQPDGTFKISSFFDIFTEISTDAGMTWSPCTSGPVRVELRSKAPEEPFATPDLPPAGQYVSPDQWHAYFAMGIVISNVSHLDFLQKQPPPPPGGSQIHNFGSTVQMLVSMDGGATFNPMAGQATVTAGVSSTTKDTATTRFFDTEMTQLDLQGGSLPSGFKLRESPTRASTGRTSIREVAPGDTRISSFFDIFPELSLDGGMTWHPSLGGPAGVRVKALGGPAPLSMTCPAPITVPATGPGGAAVTYAAPTTSGGCAPVSVVCNPPSGSTFPLGTNTVNCTASDGCGSSANCSFNVTVQPPLGPVGTEQFEPTNNLPPADGEYVSPAQWHQAYASGIIISNASHNRFLSSTPPPPTGGSTTHSFGSTVSFDAIVPGVGVQHVSTPANVVVHVAHAGSSAGTEFYGTEMLQLDISGGSLPAGWLLRESPTLQSTGQTTVRPVTGGYMISSFFDVFTELSTDYGASWQPATAPVHVEFRKAIQAPPISQPTDLLPPPTGQYVSPELWHQLYAAGVVIKDVSHSFFVGSQPPPSGGTSQTHALNSVVDMMVSTDNGVTFTAARVSTPVTVQVTDTGHGTFDTEMLALDLVGTSLPGGLMIRESPTLPSRGRTSIEQAPDGTYRIGSFFDIFTELSTDGGMTWQPANGPTHVELKAKAEEGAFNSPNLPPAGEYVSPEKWHAYYAMGIVISNVSHDRFTQTTPPPAPGGSATHNFGSTVTLLLSTDGGVSFTPASAPATVTTHIASTMDVGGTRFFDTEMLSLDLAGGTLPPGVMVRESPTKASTGRTTMRNPAPGDYRIGSFFDIFTEITVDGGMTWHPALGGPATMAVRTNAGGATPLSILCPSNITVTGTAGGAVVTYAAPTTSGGCAPVSVVCNPPSGSTFPLGTNTVNCTASDGCGSSANCSFNVNVLREPPKPAWFPQPLLPPAQGEYVSPERWHQLYANGIIISNASHRRFTQSFPPPAPGTTNTHTFGSTIEVEVSQDGGNTFSAVTMTANSTVRVAHAGTGGDGTHHFDTEMLALSLSGPGLLIRESPTLPSRGQTSIRPASGGGFMIGSFFDIFTEVSLDGGMTWAVAASPVAMELGVDPRAIAPIAAPTPLLPPLDGTYISPAQYHILTAQGVIIRDVKHKIFTGATPPPPPGPEITHNFGSLVDMEVSTDGGATFQPARAPANVTVAMSHRGTAPDGSDIYDTEMLELSLIGGNLPGGMMLRESPTLRSTGKSSIQSVGSNTFHVSSFFDIFTELSLDGGMTWTPVPEPSQVRLISEAPPSTTASPNLPVPDSQYVSPADWHAAYAAGVIISNVSHQRFTDNFPPPPAGVTATHTFSSVVQCDLSTDGGATFNHVSLPAEVTVQLREIAAFSTTRYFDTEMIQLSLTGSGGMMIRESPTRASTGRTTQTLLGDGQYRVSSFFDIFTELSLDGGMTWSPAVTGPGTVAMIPAPPVAPMTVHCPADILTSTVNPAGKVVTFLVTYTAGDCPLPPPPTVTCVPPSGSTFPIGTTTVTCTGNNGCGEQPSCSFNVTVAQSPIGPVPGIFFKTNNLPPLNGEYISPAQWHQAYASGIIISNASHNRFLENMPPPPAGESQTHSFGSTVEFDLIRPGLPTARVSAPAQVSVHVASAGSVLGTQYFDTEMLALDIQGGGLPPGLRLRESPTIGSQGGTTIQPAPGGYLISSFFDVFTELSADGGQTWEPSPAPVHVELRKAIAAPPVSQPTDLLPPPNGGYVSPADWHAAYAAGIIISNVSHSHFVGDLLHPPATGGENTHTFNSQIDLQASTDGGATFTSIRVPAPVTVRVSSTSGGTFDTEMTALDIEVPSLGNIRLRESPTLPSRGRTSVARQPDGTYRIASFFDIFTELSLDGGMTWQQPITGPGEVQLRRKAPEKPVQSPGLPPLNGEYVSPEKWHALYANGIVISNASHKRFLQNQPPPPPGGSQVHNFGSTVEAMVSTDGGHTFTKVSGPASVAARVTSSLNDGSTRFFETEMLALNISLPGGVMIRESPSKASLGRTSQRTVPTGGYMVSSFFDIFTEISIDGGMTWSPTISPPAPMTLAIPPRLTTAPTVVSNAIRLDWTGSGRLQYTESLGGSSGEPPAWREMEGTPPFDVPITPGTNRFFRIIEED